MSNTEEQQEEMVSIPKARYEELLEDQKVLNALRAGGVDNWEWYEASLEDHWE